MFKGYKHIWKDACFVVVLVILGLILFEPASVAWAKQYLPLQGEGWDVFPQPAGDTGIEMAKSLAARIVDNVRYIIGAIAILLIIVSSFQMIMAEGNEEEYDKHMKSIIYGIIGLVLIGLAGDLSQVFSVDNGGFLRDPAKALKQVRIFDKSIEIVLVFIKYIVGGLATLFIVRSGLRMITLGSNDEELAKDKKNLAYGIIGLIFILMATPLVNEVFYKIDYSKYPGVEAVRSAIDASRVLRELVGVTNLIVMFTGPFAILSLIGGSILYITAGGEDEKVGKAKKIIIWSLIGIIIIYGAFAVVSTFVAGKFQGI